MVRNITSSTSGTGNQAITAKRIVVRRGATLNISNGGGTVNNQYPTQMGPSYGPGGSGGFGSGCFDDCGDSYGPDYGSGSNYASADDWGGSSAYQPSSHFGGFPQNGPDGPGNWQPGSYGSSVNGRKNTWSYNGLNNSDDNNIQSGRHNRQKVRNDQHTRNVLRRNQFYINTQA